MVNMSKIQLPHKDKKCQLKATDGSSINDGEIHTPQGRLKLSPKQHQLYSGPIYSSSIKIIKQYIQRPEMSLIKMLTSARFIQIYNEETIFSS